MHSRAFRILLLALVTVWYGAVLPGHQRGVVQLPGAGGDACCRTEEVSHCGEPASDPTSPRSCAVCFYMAALEHVAPPDLGIAPLGPAERDAPSSAPVPATVRVVTTYLGRAPPLA